MSVAIDKVVEGIEKIAPKDLAYDWDNTGLLLRCAEDVKSILITLDVTHETVDEAIALGCDMILSHHPLIFTPMKTLSVAKPTQSVVMRMIESGISLYASHTSYDRVQGGMNDVLANQLNLRDIEAIDGDGEGLMRTGFLPKPMSTLQLIEHIKRVFDIKYLKTSDTKCDIIGKVAVIGGSGGDFVAAAKNVGATALITGEVKHHHFIEAQAMGVLLVEAGHYDTERFFVDDVFLSLQSWRNKVQLDLGLKKAKCVNAPYRYI